MTSIEATAPVPAGSVPAVSIPAGSVPLPPDARSAASGRFLGSESEFFWLLVRGHLLLMATLGIYRFWLNTDVRRFLWGHTEVVGDGLEYTGTARELLIGFLMAIVLLVPINALLFVGTLVPELLPLAGPLGIILLALLGQFAVFRARRYRLTRTIYRGVRFFQTGSGWNYSLRSNLWLIPIVLTAGLAYPWAAANLERYKMRHTFFGDLAGRFDGSGTRLFLQGILLWLVVMGPLLVGTFGAAALIDWGALAKTLAIVGYDPTRLFELSGHELAAGVGVIAGAVTWSILSAVVLYPVFRAIVMRWWISGVRLGPVVAVSRLRIGQMYRTYLRFIWYAFLFSLGGAILGGLVAGLFASVVNDLGSSQVTEIGAIVLGLAGYVAAMLGYSAIYQATVTVRIWRLGFEMTDLSGTAALDGVVARGEASSPFGEGLADALDVGGL